ncbi:MAG: efflux RND transporter periplasmic adaptor subunit [Betaproteobacteria bacterium HGW-Betaproteobacteria-3]|jgi:RND family efflux transporter MFP subunit|nr:MAG: efflux RND transporter periplasmic adaptor subunit [Betaproteobacteria bacterium HGW-Betaproteobacteria-3]
MNHPRRAISLTLLLAVVGSAAMLGACSRPAPQDEPIRAVKVLTVGTDAMQTRYEFAGEVRARVESRIGFRVAGKIIQRQAELGQHVKAGQLLAQIDPQDYRLAADAARAQLAAAQTNLDLAAADYQRFATLKDQNFISGAELERRQTTLKAAQAQLEQAQAQLRTQGNQAGYANLVAEVAGVVTAVEAEPGQVVQAGTPVVRIAQDGPRDAVFSVPEDRVAAVKLGSGVRVRAWALDRTVQGTVREVAASADPVTRTYAVKVALPAQAALPLGATIYAVPDALSVAGAPVLKLPTSALWQDGQATAVWVLEPATLTVRAQRVEVATADGNEAVIAAGLQPGMQVVAAGVHVLSPGQKVTIYESKQAIAPVKPSSSATESVANKGRAASDASAPVPAASASSAK